MTVNIQFKRGSKVNLPSSAPSGTPLWCEDTKELYIGTGDNVTQIGAQSGTSSGGASSPNNNETILFPLLEENTYYLTDNSIHRIDVASDCTFVLPEITDHTIFHQMLVQVSFLNSASIDLGTCIFFNDEEPDLSDTSKDYNIIYEHNGSEWVVGCCKKGVNEVIDDEYIDEEPPILL